MAFFKKTKKWTLVTSILNDNIVHFEPGVGRQGDDISLFLVVNNVYYDHPAVKKWLKYRSVKFFKLKKIILLRSALKMETARDAN